MAFLCNTSLVISLLFKHLFCFCTAWMPAPWTQCPCLSILLLHYHFVILWPLFKATAIARSSFTSLTSTNTCHWDKASVLTLLWVIALSYTVLFGCLTKTWWREPIHFVLCVLKPTVLLSAIAKPLLLWTSHTFPHSPSFVSSLEFRNIALKLKGRLLGFSTATKAIMMDFVDTPPRPELVSSSSCMPGLYLSHVVKRQLAWLDSFLFWSV